MGQDAVGPGSNIQPQNVDDLLRAGIAAAKSGQREHAHDLLMHVVEQDEENISAWLWLSTVVDSLDDREVCLENVLTLDPDNDVARNGLEVLHRQRVDRTLREGIAAAKSGQREQARELLMRAVEQDERNVSAWLWLGSVVGDLDEREACLENALSLDPDNDAARRGLALVQKQKQKHTQPPLPAPVPESPVAARARTAATPVAAVLGEDFASRQLPPEPEPPPSAVRDEFDDEYLCPYCAVLTEPQDRKCKACGGDLWIRFRRQEERSTSLWTVLPFQFFVTFLLGQIPLLVLIYVGLRATNTLAMLDISDPLALLDAYLNSEFSTPLEIINAAFAVMSPFFFLLSFLPCLFSLVVFIGLYLRWKPAYYLLLAEAVGGLIAAAAAMLLAQNIVCGAGGAALGLLMLLLAFRTEDDFQWDKKRVVLRTDPGLSSGTDFILRGSLYAKRKMWAMSAIHLRRAVAFLPSDPDCHIGLATVYLRLKWYDRAAKTLEKVRQISPDDPQVEKLQALLGDLRSADQAESSV
ncbi:MAG: tetratricopeptide repeat protein [Chloroflexota bacterium]|nr:tetratricopeptide repeat protein [Chloroflexota bacterium]